MSTYLRGRVWWLRYAGPMGEEIRESSGTSDRRSAERMERDRKREVAAGSWSPRVVGTDTRPTVASYVPRGIVADRGTSARHSDPRSLVFLDVDGVLNSARWMAEGHMRRDADGEHFDPWACSFLEEVTRRTGCVYVLSSAWRIIHPFARVQGFINAAGAPSVRIIGETPHWATRHGSIVGAHDRRGSEIAAWLKEHGEPARWAILDDSDDMGHLLDRLVRTSWAEGLQQEHVEELVRRLSGAA